VTVCLNDGKSLDMIPDESVDFLFSFDSLVHADADATDAYLAQFKRILKPEGTVFLHHSNYGAHRVHPWLMALGHVRGLRKLLWKFRVGGLQENRHWRAETTSAASFRESCQRVGLRCFEQELVNWGVDFLNDCFSCVARADAKGWPEGTRIRENPGFMDEAARIKATPLADLQAAVA
jgi:SAM-dependent methyltransferase